MHDVIDEVGCMSRMRFVGQNSLREHSLAVLRGAPCTRNEARQRSGNARLHHAGCDQSPGWGLP